MHRWDPLNDVQLALLQGLASGESPVSAVAPASRITGYALRNRGLITIDRRGGRWEAEVTEAGRYYLEHGQHPDHPARHAQQSSTATTAAATTTPPRADAPAESTSPPTAVVKPRVHAAPIQLPARRAAEAAELVARLTAERRVVIASATDEAITAQRRVVEYAKRHQLIPVGQRIETRRLWNSTKDFEIAIVNGTADKVAALAKEVLAPVPVPTQFRDPHPVVAALCDDADRLVMPAPQRRRALLMFQALAAEAVRREHRVVERPVPDYHRSRPYYYHGRNHPSSYSRREGELDIVIDTFAYTVTIQQESPQSTDPDKAARLVIEVPRYRATRQCAWRDRKRWTVEELLPVVLAELELRAVEDRQRTIDEERAKADRQVRWEAAMTAAKEQALQEQYAERLREQAKQWRQADALRAYCGALEARLSAPQAGDSAADIESAKQWLTWARAHVLAIDPLHGLPTMPQARKVKPEDLKPFLGEWSPHGPEGNKYGWQ